MSSERAMGLFRTACGLKSPIALMCHDLRSSAGAYTPLDYPRPFMLIGRLPAADLCLNDANVSRRHAFLQAVNGGVYCIDLESRTKTYWTGRQDAKSQGWLDPGGSIEVGPFRIHRTDVQPDAAPGSLVTDPFSASGDEGLDCLPFPRPILEMPFRFDGKSANWMPEGLLALVGRSERCQLVLADNNISNYHACLVRTPVGLWIVDLASREGLYVNEMRVRWAWLADRDRVRMGPLSVVVQYEKIPEGVSREDVPLAAGASPTGVPVSGLGPAPGPLRSGRNALALRSQARSMDLVRAEPHTHAAPSATFDGAEWEPELSVGPNPDSMWRQQIKMMQSFHNDMIMMFQMFVALHREHLGSVRTELDRVQELTIELSRLSARLDQVPGSPISNSSTNAGAGTEEPKASSEGGPTRPQRSLHSRQTGRTERKSPGFDKGEYGLSTPSARVAEDSGKSQSAPPPSMGAVETYAEITRRITEIQKERHGYWRNILRSINK